MNKRRFSQIVILSTIWCLVSTSLIGCEAMRKKFTRKKKTTVYEESIYIPVEYKKDPASNQAAYRDYILYWQSWQDELISRLIQGANRKKLKECIGQIILNLEKMKQLISGTKQKELEDFITQATDIQQEISKPNLAETSFAGIRNRLMKQKREVLRQFSLSEVKDFIK